jgi:hypothetical protein
MPFVSSLVGSSPFQNIRLNARWRDSCYTKYANTGHQVHSSVTRARQLRFLPKTLYTSIIGKIHTSFVS